MSSLWWLLWLWVGGAVPFGLLAGWWLREGTREDR